MDRNYDIKQKVFVGMSGGVDSSVSAFLLREQGCDVVGVTMDTGYGDATEAAARVCRELGIEHRIIDLKDSFHRQIIDSFVADYAAGLTPSPCILCNPLIKFAALLSQCEKTSDLVATGHYVEKHLDGQTGFSYLSCGDQAKDQSYFLCLLQQEQIARCVFPLEKMNKDEVRSIARKQGICSAERKDSFDVCFIPDRDYRKFLREHGVCDSPGEIVDADGSVVGRHSGLCNYTIGQRRGVEVSLGYPAYVLELDSVNNRLVIGRREQLYKASTVLKSCVFQSIAKPENELRCQVRVRHKAALSQATLEPMPQLGEDCYRLEFCRPEWGLTPGQYAAFYDGERLLGGGLFSR